MKKRIAVEIETSEDGKYCGENCWGRWVNRRECMIFNWHFGKEIKRCPACIKAECKAKEVEA